MILNFLAESARSSLQNNDYLTDPRKRTHEVPIAMAKVHYQHVFYSVLVHCSLKFSADLGTLR